ncbi:acetyl-CoA C-acyltransferase [Sagittula stellata]|nr:acetyl-CoA C-acyltransferase [Sagittula stellata]
MTRPVFIVDGARTPFHPMTGTASAFSAADLAVQCGQQLLIRQPVPGEAIGMVLVATAPSEVEGDLARETVQRLDLPATCQTFTLRDTCGAGMQALNLGLCMVREGQQDVVLVGGADVPSRAPMVYRSEASSWFSEVASRRAPLARVKALADGHPEYLLPVRAPGRSADGPASNPSAIRAAEAAAYRFGIDRASADAYAAQSHARLSDAMTAGRTDAEVVPRFGADGTVSARDCALARVSAERLSRLTPASGSPFGSVTTGNAAVPGEGACWLMIASDAAVDAFGLTPLAKVTDSGIAAVRAADAGLAPAIAALSLIDRNDWTSDDVGLWEIKETMAAQVLACAAAFSDEAFCRDTLGDDRAVGAIDPETLNVDGGAIALGLPVGADCCRMVLHLAHALRTRGAKKGVAMAAIGGGQGASILLETV